MAAAAMLLIKSEAFADSASYLKYKPVFTIEDSTLGDKLAEFVRLETEDAHGSFLPSDSIEMINTVIYNADLYDCGTFSKEENAYREYKYLVTENKFAVYDIKDLTQYEGEEYTAKVGDAVFFLNDNKRPLTFGIITGESNGNIVVSCQNYESDSLRFIDIKSANQYNVKIIGIIYPTVEEVIFSYLKENFAYTTVTCCGIISNIYFESYFDSNALEMGGKGGYGLCQWTDERRTALISWCEENSFDYTHIIPQLEFMKFELKGSEFKPVDSMLRSVSDNADGAYDAAHAFCYFYLMPQDYEDVAEDRGEFASDTVYSAFKFC